MLILELFIGEVGAENMSLISYLSLVLTTFSFYILGIIKNWSLSSFLMMIIISVLSIISNIFTLPVFYILPIAILFIFGILKLDIKKEIKNKVAPNIISLFLMLFVLLSGSFIVLDTAKDGVNKTIDGVEKTMKDMDR